MPATLSDAGDTTGKGNSDDGLFDATYSFLVPATLSTGTLEVAAGPFTGAEFTLYTAESGTTTLEVAAPATLALSFPPPVTEAAQRTPPWVGQPAPPTAVAPGSQRAGGLERHAWLPVWAAIVILLLVAAGVLLVQRRRTGHRGRCPQCDAPAARPAPRPSSRSGRAGGTGRGSPGSRRHLGRRTSASGAARCTGCRRREEAPEAGRRSSQIRRPCPRRARR